MYNDTTKGHHSMMQECEMRCGLSCHREVYKVDVSTLRFPSESNTDAWVKYFTKRGELEKDHAYCRRNLVGINVYFTSERFLLQTQKKAFDLYQMISDLGGQLGLWLGLSVTTFAEILQHISQAFYQFILFIWRKTRDHGKETESLKDLEINSSLIFEPPNLYETRLYEKYRIEKIKTNGTFKRKAKIVYVRPTPPITKKFSSSLKISEIK